MSKRPKPKQDKQGNYVPNGAAAKGGLNKSIVDAGWGIFQQFCTYKAENAGRDVLFVNPRYTSQVCSGCGTVKKKELSERWHSCECGTELDRDHNAAHHYSCAWTERSWKLEKPSALAVGSRHTIECVASRCYLQGWAGAHPR